VYDCFHAAVGQCELIVQYHSAMIPCKGIEHKNLQAAVGQLNLIGKANAGALVGGYPC